MTLRKKKAIKANIVSVHKTSVLEKVKLKWSRCPYQKILALYLYRLKQTFLILIPCGFLELELAELGYATFSNISMYIP